MAQASGVLQSFDPARPLIDYVTENARLRPDAPALLLRDGSVT